MTLSDNLKCILSISAHLTNTASQIEIMSTLILYTNIYTLCIPIVQDLHLSYHIKKIQM